MSVRFFRHGVVATRILVVAGLLQSGWTCVSAYAGNPPAASGQVGANFGLTKVWSMELTISAKEYEAMQPALAAGFGPPPMKADDNRPSEKNLFGTEFPWAEADVVCEGKELKKVGVRYAGDITYFMSAQGLKRPLKIAFEQFGGPKFHGLSALQLHAMPLDPAKAREALALAIFRDAKVLAPRTAFAEVFLTVSGKFKKEPLGLFTVVEEVDAHFFADRLNASSGLAVKPFQIRGIDFLGEDWNAYKDRYRPQREATNEEAVRVIEFAKLVHQASDEEFQKQIGSFIDVDGFLRFLAANALTANLESFFALGHNYHLYLDAKTKKFHFAPGDLEFSFANFLLMGTADQLMDLSVVKPYPGESKLADRLLANKEINGRYRIILKELFTTVFTKERLLRDAEAIAKATLAVREREEKAVLARKEPPPGFGGPGGPGAGMGPQPPDLKTFAEKRTASIEKQLLDQSRGYIPQAFGFGPPPGGAGGGAGNRNNAQAINERTFREQVQVPPQFDVTLFGVPPQVNYPVAIACEPAGAVYVAVDEQGSLGRTPGGGKILRCTDSDGDGKVDKVTVFAKVDHPRGVTYLDGKVWVMHPPTLSVFQDDNGDGVADRQEVLVTGLTTEQITNRGGDHTTNGVRMGIDGWLYIGVGDYGIKSARGADGKRIVLRGGGVVRVRPDGSDLEIYCSGLRNPFDLAIDPFLNIFTRDNTNDGAGWDTRVSLLKQTALYGYTQLFANFTDEIMPTLGVFGNGGGSGALFLQDPRWPPQFQNTLFTGDWGRSEVYQHDLKASGPTFDLRQEPFMKIPRATGMDIDAQGRLYVASWYGGESAVYVGPNIGFVARVVPKGLAAESFPDLKAASLSELTKLLGAPQSVARLHAQGELLARGKSPEILQTLVQLASDSGALLEGRVAAIWTLKQLAGTESRGWLVKLLADSAVREFALRALTDRKGQLEGVDTKAIVACLNDESPRVRAQALISLGRLNDRSVAKAILPLTARPAGSSMPARKPLQNQTDPDRVVPHLAVRALVELGAIDACLDALDGPFADGALWAMRSMHDPKAVEGLIKKLGTVLTPELRRGILVTLIRLHFREADYKGSWWGIRPDSTGPYYDRAEWEMTKRISAVLTAAAADADQETRSFLKRELARHKVPIAGLGSSSEAETKEKEIPIVIPVVDRANPNQIANMEYARALAQVLPMKGDSKRGEALFKSQSCVACHTTADGQTPKGPHLVEIGKRYKADELVESILKPSVKLAQGYESYRFEMNDGRVFQGFVASERADATVIREANGLKRELKKSEIEARIIQKTSAMPEGLAANLTPAQLADLIAYLQSLK